MKSMLGYMPYQPYGLLQGVSPDGHHLNLRALKSCQNMLKSCHNFPAKSSEIKPKICYF